MATRWWQALGLAILLLPLWPGMVRAADFDVPGLDADSTKYVAALTAKSPAGLSAAQRRLFETRAAEAVRKSDWAGAVAAFEARLGGGDGTADQWMALGRAQLKKTPPDPARAAQAAWQAFGMVDDGVPEVPPLLLMADAFQAMKRFDVAIQALEAAQQRVPDNTDVGKQLLAMRQLAGIQVRRVHTEVEADPPSACVEFTTAPARRGDFVAADWVQLSPAAPNAAITRQGDQICIAGLRLGATTTITLRAGMPGEDRLKLNQDTVLRVAMANRSARLDFDSRMFLLPRGQVPTVTLASVNLSRVKLQLLRLSERNVPNFTAQFPPGSQQGRYSFTGMRDNGKIVWQGEADIPHWQPNQLVRTVLPLPDAFQDMGAYILLVTPGDGTPEGPAATQVVMRTDLAPTVWRGRDGLTVQVRSFADAAVQPGVALRLLARSNDVLATAVTDPDGVARFAAPLLRGEGPQSPQSVEATLAGDFVSLDLAAAAFDLSDRGVEGAAQPGALDAFAWTDRGIYRPGETVQVMALLRDAAGTPQDIAVHVVVKRPNGQVLLDAVPSRGAKGSVHLPVALSLASAAGEWSIEVLADPKRPPVGRTTFRVDAFVPDRMAVDLAVSGVIVPGQTLNVPVTARFLYGAPAAGLSGSASVKLVLDPSPPTALAGFRVGLDGEQFAPDALTIDLPDTDAAGQAVLPIRLGSAPDSTHPVRAELDVGVNDPSGHASHASASIPVRPAGKLLGIKPLFDNAVDAGGEAAFEMAAVDAGGARTVAAVKLRLVRERPDWRLVQRAGLSRYETVLHDEPIEAADLQLMPGSVARYAKRLDFGRYRLEITEVGGLAATSVRFRAGWVASDSPDTPDKVDVSTDKKLYRAGEVARLHIAAPFAGPASLLTLTDRVFGIRTLAVAAGGTDVEVPVDAAWGPGAYAAVHVFRGPDGSVRPDRAIGVVWIGIDPAARTLALKVDAPDKVLPRSHVTIPVRTLPGAWVTLAAVDEGVLRLTSFVSPDPAGHFLGRRTLGIDIRDDWGRLIAPGEGGATVLRQGGDEGGSSLPEIPQKVVALFTPPMQAGPDGVAQVPLDLPDFNGQVRLMAVGWQGTLVGGASVDMLVRDPLIAEPLLPRFLAPGDETRLAVLLQNLELPAGEAAAVVSVDGPLAITGQTRLAAVLEPKAQAVRTTTLKATGAGRGTIHLTVTGPGGFTVNREVSILIRPARAPVNLVAAQELAPGVEAPLQPNLAAMVAGTGSARAVFGGAVRFDVAALLRGLADYPLSCLEQVSSRGLPLTVLPDGALAGPDRMARLGDAVASVLDRQRFDGGFGLWSAAGDAEPWLSAYATEFLIRAKQAGAPVPDGAMKDALTFIGDAVASDYADSPADRATRAYDLYVLALAGQAKAGANRLLAEDIGRLPTPLARAQLGAALALSNDRTRAEAAFSAALAAPARQDWDDDRGSALRDQMAVAVLLKESGLLADRLPRLLATLPGADLKPDTLNTQEEAWAATAGAVLGRDSRPTRVAVDGKDIAAAPIVSVALMGGGTARNLGEAAVWQTVSTSGIPMVAPAAARSQMRVTRRFFTMKGDVLDLSALKQNTVFVMLLEGRADDAQDHRTMVLQGLPAGWEIAGRLQSGRTDGMPWLGTLSDTDSQPAADDRFAATLPLTKDAPGFRVAVRVRAVTPGDYEMPGASISDMYRPGVFARQGVNRVKVLAAE